MTVGTPKSTSETPVAPVAVAWRNCKTAWWPHLRAALVLPLCLFTCVDALPSLGVVNAKTIQKKNLDELLSWHRRLGSVGYEETPEQLAVRVASAAKQIESVPHAIFSPVQPLYRFLGIRQGWSLFSYPDSKPHRLEVWGVEKRGKPQLLFRSGDTQHRYLIEVFQYRRVRGTYHPRPSPPKTYNALAKWIARRTFDDFPEFERVVIQQTVIRTPEPGEPPVTGLGKRILRRRFDREPLMSQTTKNKAGE